MFVQNDHIFLLPRTANKQLSPFSTNRSWRESQRAVTPTAPFITTRRAQTELSIFQ